MTFTKTFHAQYSISLVWGEDPKPLFHKIRDLLNLEEAEIELCDAQGSFIPCANCHGIIHFPKKPSFKNMGTIAHEVFHAWNYWLQFMDRDINPNQCDPATLEVDAYFFSDVCDWIYECLKTKSS